MWTIKSLYIELNHQLFDGLLPDIPVVYNNRLRRTLGQAYYRVDHGGVLVPTSIELRTNHRWTPRFKRKVLTHEMCHIWEYHFHNHAGHGKRFWSQMTEVGYPKFHNWDDAKQWERDVYYQLIHSYNPNACKRLAPNTNAKCLEAYLVLVGSQTGGSMGDDIEYGIYGLFDLPNVGLSIVPLKYFHRWKSDALNFIDETNS